MASSERIVNLKLCICRVSDCPFNHSGKPEKQEQPCKQFQKTGKCHYGDNCKFSHSPIREEFGKLSVWVSNILSIYLDLYINQFNRMHNWLFSKFSHSKLQIPRCIHSLGCTPILCKLICAFHFILLYQSVLSQKALLKNRFPEMFLHPS